MCLRVELAGRSARSGPRVDIGPGQTRIGRDYASGSSCWPRLSAQQLLHELHVQQVELKMQDEKQGRTQLQHKTFRASHASPRSFQTCSPVLRIK